jgi:hypothetical protein
MKLTKQSKIGPLKICTTNRFKVICGSSFVNFEYKVIIICFFFFNQRTTSTAIYTF